jgi:hypothetical protein
MLNTIPNFGENLCREQIMIGLFSQHWAKTQTWLNLKFSSLCFEKCFGWNGFFPKTRYHKFKFWIRMKVSDEIVPLVVSVKVTYFHLDTDTSMLYALANVNLNTLQPPNTQFINYWTSSWAWWLS